MKKEKKKKKKKEKKKKKKKKEKKKKRKVNERGRDRELTTAPACNSSSILGGITIQCFNLRDCRCRGKVMTEK